MPVFSGTSPGHNLSLQALQEPGLLQEALYSGHTSVCENADQGVSSHAPWEKHLLPKAGAQSGETKVGF